MATFKQLQDRVKNRIIDLPDATVAEIPNFINEAIIDAENTHNFRIMEASIEMVTTQGTHTLGDIASFKEMRARPWVRMFEGNQVQIEWAPSEDQINAYYARNDLTAIGRPESILQVDIDDDQTASFEVYPYADGLSNFPDDEYRVNLPYWKYLPRLVGDNDENWFTNNAEQFVVWAAAAKAFEFNEDDQRADRNLLKAQAELQKLVKVDKRSRLARNLVLTPRRDVNAFYLQRRM